MATKNAFISAVTGPTVGIVNQELTLIVAYDVENRCGIFNKFPETTTENTKEIEVETNLECTDCGTTAVTKTTTYKFKSSVTGTYVFKFKKNQRQNLSHKQLL
jgi:hypothetical protein